MPLDLNGSESPGPRSVEDDQVGEPSRKRPKLPVHASAIHHASKTRRKTACQSCRMRKVKCDAVRPKCGICQASSSICHYTDPLPERLTLESATDILCTRLAILQDTVDNLPNGAGYRPEKDHHNHGGEQPTHRPNDTDRPLQFRTTGTSFVAEPSKDFLQIPAHRTSADAVLNWEVFEGQYPALAFVETLFRPAEVDLACDPLSSTDSFAVTGGLVLPKEEQIPVLVDKFLRNVHTKNPVLDVDQLVRHARVKASKGLGWDAWSCLVLLASALGTIAKPFGSVVEVPPDPYVECGIDSTWPAGFPNSAEEMQQAESYFVLGCRRLGGLKHSILASQCYFFAGVYLMYTLRPLLSWQYFMQSSTLYQLHMKTRHDLIAGVSRIDSRHTQPHNTQNSTVRRLEDSMYWSCFKSESEFRVELPLPQSEITGYHQPQMFPSPPTPTGMDVAIDSPSCEGEESLDGDATLPPLPGRRGTTDRRTEQPPVTRSYNEEESWYYYLTEIALRRIGNRIINTFFYQDPVAWLNIKPLIGIALEFDTQASAWSAHLPAAMQHWETNYTIRAPALASSPDGEANHVSRELSWATENRLLELRSWLYQPFLYWLIHSKISFSPPKTGTASAGVPRREGFLTATSHGLDVDDATALYHFITSGVDCNLKILSVRSLRHRHHGLWYDMRSLVCASVMLLAIVKSGNEPWISGGVEVLWGSGALPYPPSEAIGGMIGRVLRELDFWGRESIDLKHHRKLLEDITRSVQVAWAAKSRG